MKHKLVLIGLIFLLGIGCVVMLFTYASHSVQAAPDKNSQKMNLNTSGNDFSISGDKTWPMAPVTYTTFLPCIFKSYNPCPVYIDDFSDPATGWPVDEDNIAKLQYLNGEYQILIKPADYIIFAYGDFGSADFRVGVDVRPAVSLNGAGGLVFSRNASGFYLFLSSENYYSLGRCAYATSSCSPLINWTQSPALKTGFQSNHLEVLRQGTSIKLYANGQFITLFNDGTYQGVGLGMAAWSFEPNYDARFDNFSVQTKCLTSQAISSPFTNDLPIKQFEIMPWRGSNLPEN